MISLSLPRSRKTCGWSNGGVAPTHMNSCEPISMTGTPASLWKCGTTLSAIVFFLDWAMKTVAITATGLGRNARHRTDGLAGSYNRDRLFAHVNSTQSCRRREALLSSGTLCRKSGILSLGEQGNLGFPDETAAHQFGAHGNGSELRAWRGPVAACARGRPALVGPG